MWFMEFGKSKVYIETYMYFLIVSLSFTGVGIVITPLPFLVMGVGLVDPTDSQLVSSGSTRLQLKLSKAP
ncbi:hypothetical protein HanPI659440_Chr00c08g0719721 [Helianthus annuus]|nr:hypothetical protein HanPI659440_Chr00c08g0719721 [Helianthus annuus]